MAFSAADPIDPEQYGRLLADIRPGIIETPEEYDRIAVVVESLLQKGDNLSAEEAKLLALLVLLLEAFDAGEDGNEEEEPDESTATPHNPPQPYETLKRLMDARKLNLSDIADLFGNPHIAGEVLQGRRPITRNQAKQLGRFFQVPPKLFQ